MPIKSSGITNVLHKSKILPSICNLDIYPDLLTITWGVIKEIIHMYLWYKYNFEKNWEIQIVLIVIENL